MLPLSISGSVSMTHVPGTEAFLSGDEWFIYKFDKQQVREGSCAAMSLAVPAAAAACKQPESVGALIHVCVCVSLQSVETAMTCGPVCLPVHVLLCLLAGWPVRAVV